MKFYTFVKKSDLDSVMESGLASSIAISKNPKILSHIFKDKEDEEIYIQNINPQDITQKGPSVFFQKPLSISEILDIDPDHILGEDDYILLEIDYDSLSKDEDVDVFGLELEPYYSDEDYELKKDKIEGDLTEESIETLSTMNAERAWKDFYPESGYFAPNVPHGVVVTDSGYIDPKYIKVSEQYMRKNEIQKYFDIVKKAKKSRLTQKPSSEKTLRDWFARKGGKGSSSGWVDCNTCRKGKCKPCGRKKGEKRSKYPACRPTPGACKKYKKTKGKTWGKGGKKKTKKKSSEIRRMFAKTSKKEVFEESFKNELGNKINIEIKEVSDSNNKATFDAVSMSIEGPTSKTENTATYVEAKKLNNLLKDFLAKSKKNKSSIE
jgi:hypothetical protein